MPVFLLLEAEAFQEPKVSSEHNALLSDNNACTKRRHCGNVARQSKGSMPIEEKSGVINVDRAHS